MGCWEEGSSLDSGMSARDGGEEVTGTSRRGLSNSESAQFFISFTHSLVHSFYDGGWIPPAMGIMLAAGNTEAQGHPRLFLQLCFENLCGAIIYV